MGISFLLDYSLLFGIPYQVLLLLDTEEDVSTKEGARKAIARMKEEWGIEEEVEVEMMETSKAKKRAREDRLRIRSRVEGMDKK